MRTVFASFTLAAALGSQAMLKLLALLIAVTFSAPAFAANWYVNIAVGTSGNGTSWSTAWKNFSNINWSGVQPGDTIYIAPGTYNQTLTVKKSGNATARITIRRATGTTGTVTINGGGTRSYGVVVDGYNYVTVSDLTAVNHAGAGFRVRNVTAGVIIERNVASAGNPSGNGNARGYDVRDSRSASAVPVIVRFNSYTTPTSTNDQNDGIWSSGNQNVLFQGNSLIISNSYNGSDQGHNDCLQSWYDISITVIANYCEQRNSKTGNSQGYYVENGSGIFTFINNIAYSPNTYSHQLIVDNNVAGKNGTMHAYNNTIYGGRNAALRMRNAPDSIIKNNIFVSNLSGARAVKIEGTPPDPQDFDYNLLYTPMSSYVVAMYPGDPAITPNEWQALGCDSHGLVGTNPVFVSVSARDFKLQGTSPAIDWGLTIAEVIDDYEETLRPLGSAYDIGPYEQ